MGSLYGHQLIPHIFFNIQKITSGFVANTLITTKIVMLKKLFPFEVDFCHKGLFGEYLWIL